MGDIDITLIDNSALILSEFEAAVTRALERCGSQAEGYAKDLCPVDTGTLRNSITHEVGYDGDNSVAVGTDEKYAVYVEMGTGIYASGGRDTPWSYQDAKGNWHTTRGSPAQPFIKPAVADHAQTYNNIIKDELGG